MIYYTYITLQLKPYSQTRSSVPPQNSINEFIIQKLSPLAVVDFRFISTFLHA